MVYSILNKLYYKKIKYLKHHFLNIYLHFTVIHAVGVIHIYCISGVKILYNGGLLHISSQTFTDVEVMKLALVGSVYNTEIVKCY